MNADDALRTAARLHELGISIRSVELADRAKARKTFAERGGNRAMRRAAVRRRKAPLT